MNPSSDVDAASPEGTPGVGRSQPAGPPPNWREALMDLIASRMALVQLESKDAAGEVVRRLSFVIAALCFAVFAWALLIFGSIALIAKTLHYPWHFVALVAGLLHLIICVVMAFLAKSSGSPAFSVTRAEFQKDREWIENFQKTKKSNG